MTYIKIAGIKIVRAKSGEVYRYHRGTGRRLKANPDTHLQAILDEVKALDAQTAAPPPPEKPGTLGALLALYKASPEFTQLKPASKAGYQRAIDALKSHHEKPLFKIDQIDLDMINKNGKELSIFEAKRLTAILNEPDDIQMGRAAKAKGRTADKTLVLNRLGKSYTEDGLDSSFDRIKRELVATGKIRPGLTFHGLRKSLGKAAADAGFSENDIAGALGQTNPASARPYTVEAARTKGAERVLKALAKRK